MLSPDSSYDLIITHGDPSFGAEDINEDPFGQLVKISQKHDREDAGFDITSNADMSVKHALDFMEYIPVPVVPGVLGLFEGKTKSQKVSGLTSLGIDLISGGAAKAHPLLGDASAYGIPLAKKMEESSDAQSSGKLADPDDPDNAENVNRNMKMFSTNNWNKSW